MSGLKFSRLTEERFGDLEQLFGAKGGCGGCWCMAWRLTKREYDAGRGEPNKRTLRQLSRKSPPGLLAYSGRRPIGWCAIAPRSEYSFLGRSSVLKPVDMLDGIWSISCLYVEKGMRGHGVSVELLKAAVRYARSRGARIVEGYAIDTGGKKLADPFVWTGPLEAFQRAGFIEVTRRSKSRPIMRCEVARRPGLPGGITS